MPTWESTESLAVEWSVATDDYYGFMDGPSDNLLDIGIGRFPVQTVEEATTAVDKVIHYSTNTDVIMRNWRNNICFVADDESHGEFINDAEALGNYVGANYPVYNVDKIYLDAFQQISTPGGQRAPDVNKAINSRISKGTLIMDYTGHGGEVGWGDERFLEIADINSWTNYDKLPVFITATCEFSRYDDPQRTSAGEMVFTNPVGGAIALFTTARATFGGNNFNLNQAMFFNIFKKFNGEYYSFGDLIRLSKNQGGVDTNDKKFILLGDPALKLAYPEYNAKILSIDDTQVTDIPDTLSALSEISMGGNIQDDQGNLISNFNGTIFPTIFDKPSEINTLVTDPGSNPATFKLQNNILYKGKAQVINGEFKFTFIVPKDIAYKYGFGKVSLYANNGQTDANGYYQNIIVGGYNDNNNPDDKGPDIQLFMNDTDFVSGGMTDENPVLLAAVHDANGINMIGSGIGHDLVAILDGNVDKQFVLNDFYESDLDSYRSGLVSYPFFNLSEGPHTVSLKAWDVFNNSNSASIDFNVVKSGDFRIDHLINYPNPFNSVTHFIFNHNQPGEDMKIQLRIFDMTGRLVKEIDETIHPSGFRSEPLEWNGTNSEGSALSKGMYLYRLNVQTGKGASQVKSSKLIIVK